MFKLANYMAKNFGNIFQEVDPNLERYGIRSYRIRNMTLEQVFIAIGDQEIKKEQKAEEEVGL